MLIVRATKKLLDRLGPPTLQNGEESTALLGQWYATAVFWKPQIALLVNEPTLLPVLMPLAPTATLPTRIGQQIITVLAAHGVPDTILDEERQHMRDCRTAKTANRSVLGVMNEFTHLAEAYRDTDPGTICSMSRCGWPRRPVALSTTPTSVPTANWPHSCAPSRPDGSSPLSPVQQWGFGAARLPAGWGRSA